MTRRIAGALACATVATVLFAGIASAGKPAAVPPDGAGCGQEYGGIVMGVATTGGVLGGDFNPGTVHQGLAGFTNCPAP